MNTGEFSFVYRAHLLKPLLVQNYNSLCYHEKTVSCSPFEDIEPDTIVAVKALNGNHNNNEITVLLKKWYLAPCVFVPFNDFFFFFSWLPSKFLARIQIQLRVPEATSYY